MLFVPLTTFSVPNQSLDEFGGPHFSFMVAGGAMHIRAVKGFARQPTDADIQALVDATSIGPSQFEFKILRVSHQIDGKGCAHCGSTAWVKVQVMAEVLKVPDYISRSENL